MPLIKRNNMEGTVLSPLEVVKLIKEDLTVKRHITLAEAAEIIGKSPQSMYNIMKGGHRISHKIATLMHEHFGYSIDFMERGVGSMIDELGSESRPIGLFRAFSDKELRTEREKTMNQIKYALMQCHRILDQSVKASKSLELLSDKMDPVCFDFDCQSDTEKELFYEISMWCGLVRQLADPANVKSTLEYEENQE